MMVWSVFIMTAAQLGCTLSPLARWAMLVRAHPSRSCAVGRETTLTNGANVASGDAKQQRRPCLGHTHIMWPLIMAPVSDRPRKDEPLPPEEALTLTCA